VCKTATAPSSCCWNCVTANAWAGPFGLSDTCSPTAGSPGNCWTGHTLLNITIEIVRKPPGQKGFAVIPRRWAVERTLAWLTSYRRLARDYERHPATAEAIIRWAAITTMTRRIARAKPATRPGPRQFTTS